MDYQQCEGSTDKKIVMFVNSFDGNKAAGLFEVKIPSLNRSPPPQLNINPVAKFYDQRTLKCGGSIESVASCFLGPELYMIPHDYQLPLNMLQLDRSVINRCNNTTRLLPRKFNFLTKVDEVIPAPLKAQKKGPIVTVINNKIFVLSAYTYMLLPIPEPCFEYLDLTTTDHGWKGLPTPPFHNPGKRSRNPVEGYVVLEENFILVSLRDQKVFYSYNIVSGKWKHVGGESNESKLTHLADGGVVIDHDIYTYHADEKKLYVFSYTTQGKGSQSDVSLGPASVVQGLVFNEDYPSDNLSGIDYDDIPYFMSTGAIAKVPGGNMLCVIHTIRPLCVEAARALPVCVTIVRKIYRDNYITLMSFVHRLMLGNDLLDATIQSCQVL